jgi:hypothetical protein
VKFDFLGLKTLTVLETRCEAARSAASRSISPTLPLDDAKTYEMLARGDTVGVFQVESQGMRGRWSTCGRPLRGHHRAGRALSAGPDGEHPDLLRAQARREEPEYPIPSSSRSCGDLRRHRLPGTGDADRAGPGRLHARRSRPAAPRHGQEDPQVRDGRAARALRRRRGRSAASRRRKADEIFDCSTSSPTTASTRATPRPTRWSPTRPPT